MDNGNTAVASPSAGSESSAPTAPSAQAFAEAFARDASPASPTPDASTTPPAAEQPGSEQGSPQQPTQADERSPFIPRQRFDEVNTALKELKSWKEQHGWAEQVNPQEFQAIRQIASHFSNGDTIGGLKALLTEARKDPAVAAELRSEAARILAQHRQQMPPAVAEPQMVNVQLEDGSVVAMPRDPAAWLAHQKQQWQDELRQEMQPVTQAVQASQQREAAVQRQYQIDHYVTTTHTDALTWPGMQTPEAQKAVAQELAQARIDANDPREVSLALNAAYRKVVLPTLGQQAEAKLLDSLKTKAHASTGVNPGSAAPSSPQTVTKFTQLGAEAWR